MASSVPFGVSTPTSTTPLVPTQPSSFPGPGGNAAANSFSAASNPQSIAAGVSNSAGQMFATGAGLVGEAGEALDPYLKNLEKIYGGDRAATLEAAAPQVATVSGQYDTAFRTAQTSLARGGGRNAVEASIPFQKAGAIEQTLQGEKQSAGQQIGQTATALTQVGLSAEEGGTQALTSIFGSALSAQAQTQSAIFGALGDIGEGIIDAIPFGG